MTDTQRSDLAACLRHVGMSGLARCVEYMRPGEIEARINWELARTAYAKQPDAWFQLEAAKNVARRIRKPMNELTDYELQRDHCLSLPRGVTVRPMEPWPP